MSDHMNAHINVQTSMFCYCEYGSEVHKQNSLVYSNTTIGGKPVTWKELYEQHVEDNKHFLHGYYLLMSLNRCEHGRHEDDNCFGCGDQMRPQTQNGPSVGNKFMVTNERGPGRKIGHDISGHPIVIPQRGEMHDLDKWTT